MAEETAAGMHRLGQLIREHMDEYGASQNWLARRWKVSSTTLGNWMKPSFRFRNLPDRETLEKVAAGLNIPFTTVLDAALRDAGWLSEDHTRDDESQFSDMESLPLRVMHELREGPILDYAVVDLPGSAEDTRVVAVAVQREGGKPPSHEELRRKLEERERIRQELETIVHPDPAPNTEANE